MFSWMARDHQVLHRLDESQLVDILARAGMRRQWVLTMQPHRLAVNTKNGRQSSHGSHRVLPHQQPPPTVEGLMLVVAQHLYPESQLIPRRGMRSRHDQPGT